jgi:hypothetical protein
VGCLPAPNGGADAARALLADYAGVGNGARVDPGEETGLQTTSIGFGAHFTAASVAAASRLSIRVIASGFVGAPCRP